MKGGEQKVLYYFAIFAIINELLIILYINTKNRHINPAYCLMQAGGEMQLSSDLNCAREVVLQMATATCEQGIAKVQCPV